MDYGSASASERQYLPPAVAVSAVAFALRPPDEASIGDAGTREPGGASPGRGSTTLWIPLVRRTRAPFLGRWALPGGPTRWNETLTDTALRALRDAVLRSPAALEQLYSFGSVERSAEAQRLVTIAYWALYGEEEIARAPGRRADGAARRDPGAPDGAPAAAASTAPARWDDPAPAGDLGAFDAAPIAAGGAAPAAGGASAGPDPNVAWFSADELPPLAFDHAEIVATALARLRSKTAYTDVAHRFLGECFTLGRLRSVTEAVLGRTVDPANFRRQALAQGRLEETGELETGSPHRPAKLYRFRDTADAPDPNATDMHAPTRSRS
ncbi:hypothetical protein MUN77_10800 [Leucobacter allii]|uniref:NUDIX hydrolase n=1 Tax=Leucobacter allii TaxID=2932247 RepID=UPI001FD12912|nr:hypothetical protein [Leucobacter allii]UOR00648.1 hypothetical protein MUN77_10800 [Leucobacter allii]